MVDFHANPTFRHFTVDLIFTSNDVIKNLGGIIAGVLVFATHKKFPDESSEQWCLSLLPVALFTFYNSQNSLLLIRKQMTSLWLHLLPAGKGYS